MSLQEKYFDNTQTTVSGKTLESLSRKPRFQRKKSNNKCQYKSGSKNNSSCDSFTLSKCYVKKSLLKQMTPERNKQNSESFATVSTSRIDSSKPSSSVLDSTCIQINNDSQFLQQNEIINFESKCNQAQFFSNNQVLINENKEDLNEVIKKTIFYKEKCDKYQTKLSLLKKQKDLLEQQNITIKQQNLDLKHQIQRLKSIISTYIGQQAQLQTSTKPVRSNNNLDKLKIQYLNFRLEEQSQRKSFQFKYSEINQKLIQAKNQNDGLRQDLIKHNELYKMKLKMMQQKQEFLEKTLSFTKSSLHQLQKDYQDKKFYASQSKRYTQIINEKQKQLEIIKHKYANLLKIINGQKKTDKISSNIKQIESKSNIPSFRSRHSLSTKNVVYSQKQNQNQNVSQNQFSSRSRSKLDKNFVKVQTQNFVVKCNNLTLENNRSEHYKDSFSSRIQQQSISRGRNLSSSTSQLTLFSSKSLELSPQK